VLHSSERFLISAFPAGKLLEAILPNREFTTFGGTWSLNPGKFNMKEHMVITIMANVGFTTPNTAFIIWVQYLPIYFNQAWASSFGYQLLVALSTNFIGYGLAGLTRRFLVYPSRAIWPYSLATIALNRAFHSGTNAPANGWTVSRMRWFTYCFVAMFVYFWFPNYLVAAMSYFNWTTWIAPDNVHLAAITGTYGGLGLNPFPTWDWNQCVVVGDPLINPFYSIFNSFLGSLFTFPVVLVIWYTNTWNTAYIPINSNHVFDNTGASYQVLKVVDKNGLFNETAYKTYSPMYLATGNSFLYGMYFAVYTATITHTFLFNRREIVASFKDLISRKSAFHNSKDVHTRLMRSYKEVPEYVYFAVLVVSIALGAIGVGAYPTHTSPAVALYGVFLALIFCIPCGIVMSITNVEVTLNVIAELFGGLWFPGNATAMNYFKSYGYVTTSHTLHFAQDLKLAHYIHIPPWVTFNSQVVATIVSTVVCTATLNYQMTQIPDVCTPNQKDRFTCPGVNTYFTASVLWGTLGPKKMYGPGAIYNSLLWCFLIGAIMPIPFYYLRNKSKLFKYFHTPVFFHGSLLWAPYNLSHAWAGVPLAFLFNYYIKRNFLAWWSKYN
jgi:OPT family small oligopeptide transporter